MTNFDAGLSGTLLQHITFCLFVSGPATDDKHCFDCLLVVSTIDLLGPGRTEENIKKHLTMSKNRESESGFRAYTIKAERNESATKQDYIRYEIRVQ